MKGPRVLSEFVVEAYVSRADIGAAERSAERARMAAERLTRDGTPVHYVRSIFVPEDETCLFLYEAASAEAVRAAACGAALRFEHIAEVAAQSKVEEDRQCR